MPIVSRRFAAVGFLVLFAACQQDETSSPPRTTTPPISEVPSGAVQAMIQQSVDTTGGLTTFVVRVRANDVTVSSYQGTVSFTPGAFELVDKKTPNAGGAVAVLNTDGFAQGRIRFGALTPTQFDSIATASGVEAFRFTVRALRPVGEANLVATLDVVGTDVGAAVGADRMLASPGVMKAGSN